MQVRTLIQCCLLSLTLLPAGVFACTCTNESDEAHRASGDLIFVGTAVDVRESATTFAVEKTVKGHSAKELVVSTPEATSSCHTRFAEGATYVVSARLRSGELYTDYCSRNKLVRSAAENSALDSPRDDARPVTVSSGGEGRGLTYNLVAGAVLCLMLALGVGAWVLFKRRAA